MTDIKNDKLMRMTVCLPLPVYFALCSLAVDMKTSRSMLIERALMDTYDECRQA